MEVNLKRDAALRRELDGYRFPKALAVVWPSGIRLLADRGHKLVGADRAVAGQAAQGVLGGFLAKGFQTRATNRGLVLETDEDPTHLRYRMEGTATGHDTCRVLFVAVRRSEDDPSEVLARDVALELELVRRLEPDAAARIVEASESAAR